MQREISKVMRHVRKHLFVWTGLVMAAVACENLNDDINAQKEAEQKKEVALDVVARILSAVPLEAEHLNEVHAAVTASSDNGYDEEYTMADLFQSPGRGVGDVDSHTKGEADVYLNPLRNLIENQVRSMVPVKSSDFSISDPEQFLESLMTSDTQIYWPFSEEWDGRSMPVITFDPEDGSDANIGYRFVISEEGSRRIEEVIVDEHMAQQVPVWVVNRNSDAGHTTLELLRREDPHWGTGGGTIIVNPGTKSQSASAKGLVLRDFIMHRNYDSWFAGASEFFVKVGFVDDFTAVTEAELKLYNPKVTDFMVVVKRNQLGRTQAFNTLLISDWNPQMSHCAFMITEDDGGTRTEWKCTALVRIKSMSYGVEIELPLNGRDDIVWRGQLAQRWLESNTGMSSHFGDVSMTFDFMEY